MSRLRPKESSSPVLARERKLAPQHQRRHVVALRSKLSNLLGSRQESVIMDLMLICLALLLGIGLLTGSFLLLNQTIGLDEHSRLLLLLPCVFLLGCLLSALLFLVILMQAKGRNVQVAKPSEFATAGGASQQAPPTPSRPGRRGCSPGDCWRAPPPPAGGRQQQSPAETPRRRHKGGLFAASAPLVRAAVVGFEENKKRKTLYIMNFENKYGEQWIIRKRYSEFHQFYLAVRGEPAAAAALAGHAFPERLVVFRQSNQEVQMERLKGLDDFISRMVKADPIPWRFHHFIEPSLPPRRRNRRRPPAAAETADGAAAAAAETAANSADGRRRRGRRSLSLPSSSSSSSAGSDLDFCVARAVEPEEERPPAAAAPPPPPPPPPERKMQSHSPSPKGSRKKSLGITGSFNDIEEDYFYSEGTHLGLGHFAVVKRCRPRGAAGAGAGSTEDVAVKTVTKARAAGGAAGLRRELGVLRRLRHPRALRLLGTAEDADRLHLVTELCTGGELFHFTKALHSSDGTPGKESAAGDTEAIARRIFSQVLEGLRYLHEELSVVHRDLKPENILFVHNDHSNIQIKIIDFGLAVFLPEQGHLRELVGTPYYVAPEVLNKSYRETCDLWSLGVLIYTFFSGNLPFGGKTNDEIFNSIRRGQVAFRGPRWRGVGAGAKDLVWGLLARGPAARLSAAGALAHPWLRGGGGSGGGSRGPWRRWRRVPLPCRCSRGGDGPETLTKTPSYWKVVRSSRDALSPPHQDVTPGSETLNGGEDYRITT